MSNIKKAFRFIALLVIASLTTSCSKDELDHQNDFEKSKQALTSFVGSFNNSYTYVVKGGSLFVGYGWQTTIRVEDGTIVERDFKYIIEPGGEEPANLWEWTEDKDHINSPKHHDSLAARALTLEQIYNKAQTEWLIKKDNRTTFFEVGAKGLSQAVAMLKTAVRTSALLESQSTA